MDKFIDLLNDVVYNGGCLLKVEYFYHDSKDIKPASIIFTFQQCLTIINSISDDDTVEITSYLPAFNNIDGFTLNVSTEIPWKLLINRELQWAWCLTNQQGYLDGVQLGFKIDQHNSVCESSTIQLLSIASSIETYYLVEERVHISLKSKNQELCDRNE